MRKFDSTFLADYDNRIYDALLRPTRVLGVSPFVIPITETIYDDTALTVKVRKQIDTTNWDEATTFLDSFGRTKKTQVKDSSGDVVSESQYDLLSRVKQVTNPYRIDASGNPTETIFWTSSSYDERGRLKFVTSPDNAVVETNYDLATTGAEIGTVTTVIDQALKQRRSVTNALGQLIRVDEPSILHNDQLGNIDAPHQPTKYEYNGLGDLKKVIQGEQERLFSYDSLKRLKSATNPESGTISYNYDANSNLTSKTDARNITTTYGYDRLNRVITRSYSDNLTPTVNYFYDGKGLAQTGTFTKGKLTKVTSAISATEYTNFDGLGRLQNHQQTTDGNTYPTSYVYNLSGALLEETYPSGRKVQNTLDQDGDLQQVQSKKVNDTFKNYANSFNYTAAGAVSSMRLGNGRWENMTFNSRLQPTQIGLGTSATNQSLLKLDYEYGELNLGTGQVTAGTNNGNIAKQTITVQNTPQATGFSATQYYAYDSLNRIKIASENLTPNGGAMYNPWKQTFQYDRYGNRRFDTANGNTTTLDPNCAEAVCNPNISTTNNRLIGTTYDNGGNTTTDASGRTFIYDAENKQTKVQNGVTIIGEYFYDGDGKRVKKIVPNTGEITIFIYDASDKMVAEYSTIIEPTATAKISYLTNDHLSSPRIITDQNGAIVSRRDFMPFGEEISRTNYGNDNVREKFATYERDAEIELDFAQARIYTNKLGRFTSADPLLESAEYNIPQSWNRYSYAFNNPLNLFDPTGLIVDDFFINKDGSYIIVETDCKCHTYYLETEEGSGEYKYLDTLKENDKGLVEFPASMNFFGRYGTVDVGGGDHGAGDHFVEPIVAAGLFGLAAVLKDKHQITMSFGDMSSSNGRDPWERGFDHHSGHGHNSRSGLDVDFRYINKNGESFQDNSARSSSEFSVVKNQTVYDVAKTFGFTENYQGEVQGKNTGLTGVGTAKKHNDHGHLGFNRDNATIKYAKGRQTNWRRGTVKPTF